jgi:hypothetical protein
VKLLRITPLKYDIFFYPIHIPDILKYKIKQEVTHSVKLTPPLFNKVSVPTQKVSGHVYAR